MPATTRTRRARPVRSRTRPLAGVLALATVLVAAACSTAGPSEGGEEAGGSGATSSSQQDGSGGDPDDQDDPDDPDDPDDQDDPDDPDDQDSADGSGEAAADEPTGWGPTVGELEDARARVAEWNAPRLAGQVIVGRYDGTDPAVAGRLVRRLQLAGVSITAENVVGGTQVRRTARAVAEAVGVTDRDVPPVIGVDQEGGTVAHLRGIATDFPSFSAAGLAVQKEGRAGDRAVRRAARATGLELRDLGFTWVFAPVADVTIGAGDPTIGSRSPSSDPQVAARAVESAVAGYTEAGVVSTAKHFPGHGAVTEDSHLTLPKLDTDVDGLRQRELPPFRAAVEAGAPAVMVGHLDVPGLSGQGVPTSLAPETYGFLRDRLGFEGVAVTDSLGMGAVQVDPRPALTALRAGADLLLMPADTRSTHGTVTAAIADGRVSRERVEEAAARVLALQSWQARAAGDREVPDDVSVLARDAAQALESAAY